MNRPQSQRNSIGRLSVSHVKDSMRRNRRQIVEDQAILNDHYADFLNRQGVTYTAFYGPDRAHNRHRFNVFKRRIERRAEDIPLVRTNLQTQETFVREEDFDFPNALREALQTGPILASILVKTGLDDLQRNTLLPSSTSYVMVDGELSTHTCVLTGYGTLADGREYFEILNSWGSWCDEGLGFISEEDILEAWMYDIQEIVLWRFPQRSKGSDVLARKQVLSFISLLHYIPRFA
ncbi:cysteine proteinases superfamily protein [Striga asiatica]|uniref:Cysteine proteinases superfamily protein n=1 Tax=Striga asiatica TaxID=4170 RepID=A0A5A7PJB7_STRAF|nr:cysteine proteinases superfamily protein [Striga asiatica]